MTQQQSPAGPGPSRYTVKAVTDAACAWGAAERKLAERVEEWCTTLRQAREHGVPPETLRDAIVEGAASAKVPEKDVPGEVYRAAGLDVPNC